jgi:acetate kinase
LKTTVTEGRLLTVNAGSSSIKFAVFDHGGGQKGPRRILTGEIDRIGTDRAELTAKRPDGEDPGKLSVDGSDHGHAARQLLDWLGEQDELEPNGAVAAVAHRVVHGGLESPRHQRITPELLERLRAAQTLDLDHLPREIQLIEVCQDRFPDLPHVACFDTVFHRDLPARAQLLPIPREFLDRGVRRLGFHGLSYAYLLEELARLAGDQAARGRVVLAHLGSGASMAAVRDGRPVETTMGLTPTSGLVMSSRPGDLDPGLLVYLMRTESMTPDQLDRLVSTGCGLAGMSRTGGDMRELLAARREGDRHAAEAIELFCYRARTWLGALAAALGGLDTLVFAGGIGEKAAPIRGEICEDLDHLGLVIDRDRNEAHAPVISEADSRVTVRVIATDEEAMMARIAGEEVPWKSD